jgi:hypothetical protein
LNISLAAEEDLAIPAEEQARSGMLAMDEGGPTKVFLSRIWQHVGNLAIPDGKGNYLTLFAKAGLLGQLVPQSDEWFGVKLKSSDLDNIEAVGLRHDIYRAIGRVMLYCLRSNFHIADHALPNLYRNYLIRGIGPLSEDYKLNDLLEDVLAMMEWKKEDRPDDERELMQQFLSLLELEDTDEDEDIAVTFRKAVDEIYIGGRKIALEALQEGITLNGKYAFPIPLHNENDDCSPSL